MRYATAAAFRTALEERLLALSRQKGVPLVRLRKLVAFERLRGPDPLSFADISPAEVPTLPLDQHVAEKVHAYTRSYAAGHSSSRTKDLIDLVLIASLFPFRADRLRSALRATFDARGTHPLPATLPPPPAGWGPAYRKLVAELGLQPEVSIGYQRAAAFLDPILGSAATDAAQWDPAQQTW